LAVIDSQGLIVPNSIYFISNKELSQLPFGKDVDSLISVDTSINKVTLVNHDYKLNLYFDAPNIVFWKKPTDNFICVEPYYGYSDAFDVEFPSKIEDKQDIIKLGSSDTFTSMYVIEYLKKS
jgi:galactose mutarotase-like enzyme